MNSPKGRKGNDCREIAWKWEDASSPIAESAPRPRIEYVMCEGAEAEVQALYHKAGAW